MWTIAKLVVAAAVVVYLVVFMASWLDSNAETPDRRANCVSQYDC